MNETRDDSTVQCLNCNSKAGGGLSNNLDFSENIALSENQQYMLARNNTVNNIKSQQDNSVRLNYNGS